MSILNIFGFNKAKTINKESTSYKKAALDLKNTLEFRQFAAFQISDTGILRDLISQSEEREIRLIAIKKINNNNELKELVSAYDGNGWDYRHLAISMITDADYLKMIILSGDSSIRISALQNPCYTDQESIIKYYNSASDVVDKLQILENISDQEFLEKIAREEKNESLQGKSYKRIKNQSLLGAFASGSRNSSMNAAEAITDQDVLKNVATTAYFSLIRIEAIKRIYDQSFLEQVLNNPSNYYGANRCKMIGHPQSANMCDLTMLDEVSCAALKNITSINIAKSYFESHENHIIRSEALRAFVRISPEGAKDILIQTAKGDSSKQLRLAAIELIGDQEFLLQEFKKSKLMSNSDSRNFCEATIKNIDDEKFLSTIALSPNEEYSVRLIAIEALKHQNTLTLKKIIESEENEYLRKAALRHLLAIHPRSNSAL